MSQVDTIIRMIKNLKVGELIELRRRLEADPSWPAAGAPVGAKPKGPAPTLSAAAEERRREE